MVFLRGKANVAAVTVGCAILLAVDEQHLGPRFFSDFSGLFGSPYSLPRLILCCCAALLCLEKAPKMVWIMYHTLPRDILFLFRICRVAFAILKAKACNSSMVEIFEATTERHPDKTMIVFVPSDQAEQEVKMTFREVDDYSNRVGNYFLSKSYQKGDVVAMFMENNIHYTSTWLGLAKLGVIASLTNIHIRGKSLTHTLNTVEAKAIIFSSDTEQAILEVLPDLPKDFKLYKIGTQPPSNPALAERTEMISSQIDQCEAHKPQITWERPGLTDKLMYVFTSGTTGLPKAATIRHSRYVLMGWALFGMCGLNGNSDVLYTMLPMYHSSANGLVTGAVMVGGTTVVMRKKFSASNYWKDCAKYGVTAAQYIGEVARYLIQTPPNEWEEKHKVRLMIGNGLRSQIWDEVRNRFRVDICEFYGATEGNCSMVNFSNRKGAIGFTSGLFPFLVPLKLAKIDLDSGEVVRDPKTGLVQLCAPGEAGELIAPIDRGNPIRDYDGYVNKADSEKKILLDVKRKGDMCFRSGDLVIQDELGWIYFVDRCGDTFRWKGENVSTTEVEGLLQQLTGYKDVAVYGVEIPGCEGRAGMAAISMPQNKEFDFADFYAKIEQSLPGYSRPIFLRITDALEVTTTHKIKKRSLQSASYKPESCGQDTLLVMDRAAKRYVPLTRDLYQAVVTGKIQY